MIKTISIIAVVLIGIYLGFSYAITSGAADKYLDKHQDYKWAPAVEYYIGQFNVILGQWDKAIYRFSRVTEKYSSDKYASRAQFELASAWDQKGAGKTALVEYQKLIELYPGSPNEETARKRIVVLR